MFLNIDTQIPNAIAAVDDSGQEITYGGLCTFAEKLLEKIPSRSLIFILAENSIGSLCGYTGALSNRIVPLILSARTDRELFEQLYTLYKPQYLWQPEDLPTETGQTTIWTQYGYSLIRTSFGRQKLYDELSLLLPTSGSTGSSKLVRHSYCNIETNARNVAAMFELNAQERPLVTLPMHYTMGLSVIASHLVVGATLLLTKRSLLDPSFWQFTKDQCATSFTGVPFSFEVLRKIRFFRMELPHLRLITQGGGKMPDDLFRTCAGYARDTGKQFIATYGQTEGTARMAYLPAAWAMYKTGSIGIAIPGGEITLVDDRGEELREAEAEGEMIYRGPNVTLGYARNPEDLLKGDESKGVLRTGDIVRRDVDGFHYVVGRMGRFLKLFGFRVGLDECEQLIKSEYHTPCACTGDDQAMKIFITDERLKAEIPDFLARKTGIIPTAFRVEVIREIPTTETGKTAYAQLIAKL